MKPAIKYKIIYQNCSYYPIVEMCIFFGVSRSGYYAYLKRKDTIDRDEPLARLISECQDRCGKTYGYRRVCIWLRRYYGISRNAKTILRIMNKYNLLSAVRKKRKYRQMGENLHRYENLLNRKFGADMPDRKWVTDISYIHTSQGVLYLSIIRDLYDNSIVAYKTSRHQTVSLVLDTIHLAMKDKEVTGELLLHSDQGFQYTSHAYFALVKQYGITPSMSRRGNCYDNAMAENFFSILKTECIYQSKPKTFLEADILIDEFILFYNHQRIQLKTGLSPLDFRSQPA